MPTAAKLFGAFAFAAIAFFASNAVVPLLPEGARIGMFIPISTLIGAFCGWMVAGPSAGRGYGAALGGGARATLAIVFWCLVIFSGNEMVKMSIRHRYDGPMDAIVGAFEISLEYGRMILVPDVIGILLIGGMLGGLLVEWASRRWS
ncbi:TrgA family protein [Ostreiculturibacter nitratireducens]|uniref:TrgA family protein n=1 Tax=Ostreiculturibacter nitratireducens TaxID=3075226 RepID=UPI0031B64244